MRKLTCGSGRAASARGLGAPRSGRSSRWGSAPGYTPTEVPAVQVRDIEDGPHGVQIVVEAHAGTEARAVTCRRVWGGRLRGLVDDASPTTVLVAPWRSKPQSSNALDRQRFTACRAMPPPVDWTPARLRSTWLAWQMAQGTPVPTLLRAAGLTTVASLGQMLPHVPVLDDVAAAAWLRGDRST